MNVATLEEQIRYDGTLLVKLEHRARAASEAGNLHEASETWGKREVVRMRRSYLMRMLWTYHGVAR